MGCGASSLRGDDVPSINANAKPSYLRSLSSSKPEASIEHYQTEQEHDQDLQRLQTSQLERRASKPAYVDPNDLPMPPKTTHQRYHRQQSEDQIQQPAAGWKERVKKVGKEVRMPAERRADSSMVSSGVFVPNGRGMLALLGEWMGGDMSEVMWLQGLQYLYVKE